MNKQFRYLSAVRVYIGNSLIHCLATVDVIRIIPRAHICLWVLRNNIMAVSVKKIIKVDVRQFLANLANIGYELLMKTLYGCLIENPWPAEKQSHMIDHEPLQ